MLGHWRQRRLWRGTSRRCLICEQQRKRGEFCQFTVEIKYSWGNHWAAPRVPIQELNVSFHFLALEIIKLCWWISAIQNHCTDDNIEWQQLSWKLLVSLSAIRLDVDVHYRPHRRSWRQQRSSISDPQEQSQFSRTNKLGGLLQGQTQQRALWSDRSIEEQLGHLQAQKQWYHVKSTPGY